MRSSQVHIFDFKGSVLYYVKDNRLKEFYLSSFSFAQRGPDRHRALYKMVVRPDIDREKDLYDPDNRDVYVESHINDDLFLSTSGYFCLYDNYVNSDVMTQEGWHEIQSKHFFSNHLHIMYMPSMSFSIDNGQARSCGIDSHYVYKFERHQRNEWFRNVRGIIDVELTHHDNDWPKTELNVGDILTLRDTVPNDSRTSFETISKYWWEPYNYNVEIWYFLDYGYFVSRNGYVCNAINYRKENRAKYLLID